MGWGQGLFNAIEALAPQLHHHEANLLVHGGSTSEAAARAIW
jgi:hypothetical protein